MKKMMTLTVNRKIVTAILLAAAVCLESAVSVAAPRKYTSRTIVNASKNRYEAETRYPRFYGSTRVVRLANNEIAGWARERHREFLRDKSVQLSDGSCPL